MPKLTIYISEFGVIRCKDDYPSSTDDFTTVHLPKVSFDNLYNYILENQATFADKDLPFHIFSKGFRKQIQVKNYVGVIETRDGLFLEILPKTTSVDDSESIQKGKDLLLKMLRHLKNTPFVSINNAHLQAKKNFPILEVFISAFLDQTTVIYCQGIESGYIRNHDNLTRLRGKLRVNDNIKLNYRNKGVFNCEFDEFSSNIAPNIVIKTTLNRLLKRTRNHRNYTRINNLLHQLDLIDISSNVQFDLASLKNFPRLSNQYKMALDWSEVFLTNKGFTNFHGKHVNLAILFPMERVFEGYIGYLFLKYAEGYQVKAQDKSYFLIESHNQVGKFRLKPDLLVENNEKSQIILDTKWKVIDQSAHTKNYNISQADMYQLYAYGRKYAKSKVPKLALVYPKNLSFIKALPEFLYEEELILKVLPFDFDIDERLAVESILKSLG